MTCSKYRMDNLPFQSQEIKKAKCLHHKRSSQAGATSGTSNLEVLPRFLVKALRTFFIIRAPKKVLLIKLGNKRFVTKWKIYQNKFRSTLLLKFQENINNGILSGDMPWKCVIWNPIMQNQRI